MRRPFNRKMTNDLPINKRRGVLLNKGTVIVCSLVVLAFCSLSNTVRLWLEAQPDILTRNLLINIDCPEQVASSTALSSPSLLDAEHVNWTQRIHDKRQWLQYILSSLPPETVQKSRLDHVNGTNVNGSNICEEVSKELVDSWVIHAPFGQANSTNRTNTMSQPSSFSHKMVHPTNSATGQKEQERGTRHKHAIIVPYRDRSYHLKRFIDYMDYFLHYHYQQNDERHEFSLYIMEQVDDELFNRALLLNAGLDHVSPDTECVTIHDVDLVPVMFAKPRYHTCSYPLHLGALRQNFRFSLQYPQFAGGVMTIHQQHWASINGMDYQYQGWGGEDDDMFYRLMFLGLVQCRNPTLRNMSVPHRPEPLYDHLLTTISQSDDHHTRGPRNSQASLRNHHRRKGFETTGRSPSVTGGGWNGSNYHVVHRETLSSQPPQRLGGFAEIIHIQLKVDKALLDHCYVHCDNSTTPQRPFQDTIQKFFPWYESRKEDD